MTYINDNNNVVVDEYRSVLDFEKTVVEARHKGGLLIVEIERHPGDRRRKFVLQFADYEEAKKCHALNRPYDKLQVITISENPHLWSTDSCSFIKYYFFDVVPKYRATFEFVPYDEFEFKFYSFVDKYNTRYPANGFSDNQIVDYLRTKAIDGFDDFSRGEFMQMMHGDLKERYGFIE